MQSWLYLFFGTKIAPLIFKRDGRNLTKPQNLCESQSPCSPASFWIVPPEPAILLASQRFDPALFHQPQVFLWLPHFFVDHLHCPSCSTALEKNGVLQPCQITDIQDSYYIMSWAYYCQKGCRKHFQRWSQKLISSLLWFVQLAFPAVMSHKGGLSHEVMSLLCVGN